MCSGKREGAVRAGRGTIFAMRMLSAALMVLSCAMALPAAKNLEVYFIDVEGGQATLFVPPGGESMLVDTGYPGFNHRDASRIAAAAKAAGVKRIDYLVITHYHQDHVGGVAQLAEKMPIRNFVDHGALTETDKNLQILFNQYSDYRSKGNHILAKPGDTIPVKGMDVRVLPIDRLVVGARQAGQLAGFRFPLAHPHQVFLVQYAAIHLERSDQE